MKDLFVRFRRSNAFLYTLLAAAAGYLVAHHFGFDPDYSIANLSLSLEASIATCVLLDLTFKMNQEDRRQWARMEREILDVSEDLEGK